MTRQVSDGDRLCYVDARTLLQRVATIVNITIHYADMSFMNKLKAASQKAAIQAQAFAKDSGSKISTETRTFAQGFSLPGESEKAAKILASFLGRY